MVAIGYATWLALSVALVAAAGILVERYLSLPEDSSSRPLAIALLGTGFWIALGFLLAALGMLRGDLLALVAAVVLGLAAFRCLKRGLPPPARSSAGEGGFRMLGGCRGRGAGAAALRCRDESGGVVGRGGLPPHPAAPLQRGGGIPHGRVQRLLLLAAEPDARQRAGDAAVGSRPGQARSGRFSHCDALGHAADLPRGGLCCRGLARDAVLRRQRRGDLRGLLGLRRAGATPSFSSSRSPC